MKKIRTAIMSFLIMIIETSSVFADVIVSKDSPLYEEESKLPYIVIGVAIVVIILVVLLIKKNKK